MKYLLILLIACLSATAHAEDIVSYAPDHLKEYENFFLVFNQEINFSITVNKDCIKPYDTENVELKDGLYTSQADGKVFFENFCFENEEIIIEIKSEKNHSELKYKLGPKPVIEMDFGC